MGDTVSLMLRIYKPIFGTGKYVVLDSGFCVAKVINYLESLDGYSGSLIKKRN